MQSFCAGDGDAVKANSRDDHQNRNCWDRLIFKDAILCIFMFLYIQFKSTGLQVRIHSSGLLELFCWKESLIPIDLIPKI